MSHVSSGETDRFRIVEPRSPIYAESNAAFTFQVQNPLGSGYLKLLAYTQSITIQMAKGSSKQSLTVSLPRIVLA